jgi:hypothetical protein
LRSLEYRVLRLSPASSMPIIRISGNVAKGLRSKVNRYPSPLKPASGNFFFACRFSGCRMEAGSRQRRCLLCRGVSDHRRSNREPDLKTSIPRN